MPPPDRFSSHDGVPPLEAPLGAPVSPGDPLIGQVLASRYKIERKLGRGATGAVYRAIHVKFGRAFAVKILHADRIGDAKLVRRFDREAELSGKVQHPNVVSVIDVGETAEGARFMVMELAIGIDLATVLQDESPLDSARVIHLLRGVCDGLYHAHDRGLIHRDLKPENIIVERDDHFTEFPRIVDFGIAIARDEAQEPESRERLTTTGLVLGTPHYMAPEQATGFAMDQRIDLFALGVIAYEMITGVLPFDGSGAEVARANILLPTPPMAERAPGVPVDPLLEALTRKLMEKDPDARPATAHVTRELLDLIEHDRPAAAALFGITLPAVELARPPGVIPDPNAGREPGPPPSWTMATPVPVAPGRAPSAPPVPFARAGTVPPRPPTAPVVPAVRAPSVPPAVRESLETEDLQAPRRRGLRVALVALVTVLLGGGGMWIAAHPARDQAARPVDAGALAVAPARPDAAGPVLTPDAAQPAEPADAETLVELAPPDAAVGTAHPHVDAGVVRVAPTPPRPDAAVAAVPTPAEVASLYTTIGRELQRAASRHTPDEFEALSIRYRRLRLADALATEDARREAAVTLTALRRDIAALDQKR